MLCTHTQLTWRKVKRETRQSSRIGTFGYQTTQCQSDSDCLVPTFGLRLERPLSLIIIIITIIIIMLEKMHNNVKRNRQIYCNYSSTCKTKQNNQSHMMLNLLSRQLLQSHNNKALSYPWHRVPTRSFQRPARNIYNSTMCSIKY